MTDQQRQELDRIASENGGKLVPELVIENARADDSPLHDQFTWDDTEAADKWREQEARQLIRVYIKHIPSIQRETRAYISVPSDRANGDGYRRTEDVLANPMLVDQLVDEVRKRIVSMQSSYAYLKHLDPLWPRLIGEVDKFLSESRAGAVA